MQHLVTGVGNLDMYCFKFRNLEDIAVESAEHPLVEHLLSRAVGGALSVEIPLELGGPLRCLLRCQRQQGQILSGYSGYQTAMFFL